MLNNLLQSEVSSCFYLHAEQLLCLDTLLFNVLGEHAGWRGRSAWFTGVRGRRECYPYGTVAISGCLTYGSIAGRSRFHISIFLITSGVLRCFLAAWALCVILGNHMWRRFGTGSFCVWKLTQCGHEYPSIRLLWISYSGLQAGPRLDHTLASKYRRAF
jgi:hypothetical protein